MPTGNCDPGETEFFRTELDPQGKQVGASDRYCISCEKKAKCKTANCDCSMIFYTVRLPNGNTVTDFKCVCRKILP